MMFYVIERHFGTGIVGVNPTNFVKKRPIIHAEVEITCGHRSFSVHFIRMTDHKYTWTVGVTNRSRASQLFSGPVKVLRPLRIRPDQTFHVAFAHYSSLRVVSPRARVDV